jgi:predicted dehydrogenase
VLGDIRVVQAEYPQDWLTTALEKSGQKQADWRTDPKRSGAGGASATSARMRISWPVSSVDWSVDELAAELTAFVPGRARWTTTSQVMLRFKGGAPAAKGSIWASQVAVGNENGMKLRVYGTKGGLEWKQEDPNYLWYTPYRRAEAADHARRRRRRRGRGRLTRVPPGHPEGYLEGFANIYTEAARAIKAKRAGKKLEKDVQFPGIADAVAGMAFIEACVKSSLKNGKWTKL